MSAVDYFAVFGLEQKLSLDLADLQQRFYQLSRQFHPDRFSLAAPEERARAEEQTAALNDAYRTLRNPVARAEYYLKRKGFAPGGAGPWPAAASQAACGGERVPPELLGYVFELNEALEALKSGDESVRPQIEEASARLLLSLGQTDAGIESLFAAADSGDAQAPAKLRAALDRRRYISKLLAQIES